MAKVLWSLGENGFINKSYSHWHKTLETRKLERMKMSFWTRIELFYILWTMGSGLNMYTQYTPTNCFPTVETVHFTLERASKASIIHSQVFPNSLRFPLLFISPITTPSSTNPDVINVMSIAAEVSCYRKREMFYFTRNEGAWQRNQTVFSWFLRYTADCITYRRDNIVKCSFLCPRSLILAASQINKKEIFTVIICYKVLWEDACDL